MRILFWTEYYAPSIGGIETLVGSLAEELVRQGHEAIVVTNRMPGQSPASETMRGVSVHRFNVARAAQDRNLRELQGACAGILALKRACRPDLEHVHSIGPLLVARANVQRGWPSPVLTSLHCLHDNLTGLLPADGVAAGLLRDSFRIITPSEILAATVRQALPLRADRVLAEPYGVPVPAETPAPLPFAPPMVLGCGRLIREKGFDLALRAFAELTKEVPDLRLTIAGDGVERPGLQALATELGLEGKVAFPGWVQPADLPALINRATFVLLPSRWQEPFATVALLSAHLGRPVITTEVGGMKEAVTDGLTGLVVPSENPAALAGAMRDLLRDPARTRRMGGAARARSLDRFSFARYFELHLGLYRAMASAAPG